MKNYTYYLTLVLLFFTFSCGKKSSLIQKKWELVWQEDFNNSALDSTIWSRIPRQKSDWSNYMTDADTCFALRDGKMILRGMKNTLLPKDTAQYLTGGIYTKSKKNFEYGKMVIRAKLNAGKGAWPAFWMLPQERGKWPDGGEIDIMERLSYDSIVYQTVHTPYTVLLGIKDNPPCGSTNSFNPDTFNTFSVAIYPDSLVFAVNDKHTFTYPKIETDKEQQFPFGTPYYLLLDMQLGGSWVGSVKDEDLPIEMEIDWVRFYELK